MFHTPNLITQAGTSKSIQEIYDEYSFTNLWSSENLTEVGTLTTLIDYAGQHDLSNPSAGTQPTLNASDSDFGGFPSLTFGGAEYVRKLTPNWRAADSSGVFISVYKAVDFGDNYGMLCTADNGGNGRWFAMYQGLGGYSGFIRTGAIVSKALTVNTNSKVAATLGNGTAFKTFVNGVDDTGTTGTYNWLNSYPSNRDDIAIGAATRSSLIYGQYNWVLSGYMNYTSEADLINVMNDFMKHYNI